MERTCGKCGVVNSNAVGDASEACPDCGAIYAKVDQHLQQVADKQKAAELARVEAERMAEEKRRGDEARAVQTRAYAEQAERNREIARQNALSRSLICRSCGTVGDTKRAVKGSTGLELVLWLLALTLIALPFAIVYSVWRSTSRHKVCAVCKGTELIPVGTPAGQQLYASMHRR